MHLVPRSAVTNNHTLTKTAKMYDVAPFEGKMKFKVPRRPHSLLPCLFLVILAISGTQGAWFSFCLVVLWQFPSVSNILSCSENSSYLIRARPNPVWPHFKLITSAKTFLSKSGYVVVPQHPEEIGFSSPVNTKIHRSTRPLFKTM